MTFTTSSSGKWAAPRNFAAPPPMPGQAPAPNAISPLGPADLQAVHRAEVWRKHIRKASRTARNSGLTSVVIGLAALACAGGLADLTSVLVGLGVLGVGVAELILGRQLAQYNSKAPRRLALNQLIFLGIITLYCLSQMANYDPQTVKDSILSPQVRSLNALPQLQTSLDAQVDRWGAVATYSMYSLIIVLSIAFQGGLAWYYQRRTASLNQLLAVPGWIAQLLDQTD